MLTHRYLGIAVGLVVTAWCLSGIVMMYVPYPEHAQAERLAGLAPLALDDCCRLPRQRELANIGVDAFALEMLDGAAVLRVTTALGATVTVDVTRGKVVESIPMARARAVAAGYAARSGIEHTDMTLSSVVRDQWTVHARFDPHRPLYKFSAGDAAGTEWYLSGTSGEIVQRTERGERLWNWIGAVVHWLYPTVLRQHTAVWAQTVIWLTVIGLFLTITGLYLGISQLRSRPRYRVQGALRRSPYRGWTRWHHYLGVIFGIVTLTWVFSGLMSMNPWGTLAGRSFTGEAARLRGAELYLHELRPVLDALPEHAFGDDVVRLEGSMFRGALQLRAYRAGGGHERLDADLEPAPLTEHELAAAAAEMRPDASIQAQGWLHTDDAYYYEHHGQRTFPVYRIRYADGERIYLDPARGEIALAVDGSRRWRRWLFNALHSGDFSAFARSRPIWDLFMLVLLLGTTAGAATGTYLGLRRLLR